MSQRNKEGQPQPWHFASPVEKFASLGALLRRHLGPDVYSHMSQLLDSAGAGFRSGMASAFAAGSSVAAAPPAAAAAAPAAGGASAGPAAANSSGRHIALLQLSVDDIAPDCYATGAEAALAAHAAEASAAAAAAPAMAAVSLGNSTGAILRTGRTT